METVTIKKTCIFCNNVATVNIPADAYNRFKAGEHIQHAWPQGTPAEREILISGSHEECFNKAFEGEEE